MKSALCVVLAVLGPSVVAGQEGIRDELRQLIDQDVKSGGKSAPKGARLPPLKKDAFDAVDSEIVVLPKVEVTANKHRELDARLSQLEKQQAREEKAAEPTSLDSILNPGFLGGASARARASVAQHRVEALDWQRILLISLEEAKTPEDKARIKSDIALLKGLTK